jgi:hypothetical protein
MLSGCLFHDLKLIGIQKHHEHAIQSSDNHGISQPGPLNRPSIEKPLPNEVQAFADLINNQALVVSMDFTMALRKMNCTINAVKWQSIVLISLLKP